MGYSFYVGKEVLDIVDGEPRIRYTMAYPEGFDPKQIVDEDPDYGPEYAQNPWEMFASNSNAQHMLKILGVDASPDGVGMITNLIEIEDSILRAQADRFLAPEIDYGLAIEEYRTSDNVIVVDCGRSEGYETRFLTNLLTLVQAAKSIGGVIYWC